MVINRLYLDQKEQKLRLVFSFVLVFIVAFSSLGSFAHFCEMDIDKIEKLAEGEADIDFEEKEKEKNLEGEEDTFFSFVANKYRSHLSQISNHQYLSNLDRYHSKIPTPPPDLV